MHDFARRGRLRPKLEAVGVLNGLSLPDGRRRPADVLLLSGNGLTPALPDGSLAVTTGKVAPDFAVINALGQGHWQETWRQPASAAERYAVRKAAYQDTARKCGEVGIRFVPMVFEAQGAMTKEAAAVLHAVAAAVAAAESSDQDQVKEDLLQRVSLTIARCNGGRIARRVGQSGVSQHSAVRRAMDEARCLEDPP